MRLPRLKVPSHHPSGFYHCLSRTVDRQFLFHPHERDHFLLLLRECERFCRVRVLTFSILSNHFHLLVEVPRRPDPHLLPGPAEILASLRQLSGHQFPASVEQHFNTLADAGDHPALAASLARYHARMWNLSSFMQLLKQRFTQWYNARMGRKGTLWEERYRSVVVEGTGRSLATLAAYIDLNPLRARMVKDPADYPWSGYGQAMRGCQSARAGLLRVAGALTANHAVGDSWQTTLASYRQWLYLSADERREGTRPDGQPIRGALAAADVDRLLASRGRLNLNEYLRRRVRYFCDGAVLGGRDFVEELFQENRWRFARHRRSGARRMKGLLGPPLYSWRDLRKDVFGDRDPRRAQPGDPAVPCDSADPPEPRSAGH